MSDLSFTWNRAKLTPRENDMFGAILDLCMMNTIVQMQVRNERAQATSDDAAAAFRMTIEWATKRFPDLDVAHNVTHA